MTGFKGCHLKLLYLSVAQPSGNIRHIGLVSSQNPSLVQFPINPVVVFQPDMNSNGFAGKIPGAKSLIRSVRFKALQPPSQSG
jgi:hypothetical protein